MFHPRSERIARWLEPVERSLRDLTSVGAAFVALAGRKVGPGR